MPLKMKMRGLILALAAGLTGHPAMAEYVIPPQDKAYFFCVRDLPGKVSPGLTWDDLPGLLGHGSVWCAVKTAGATDIFSYDERKAAAGFCMIEKGFLLVPAHKDATALIEAECLSQLKVKKAVTPPQLTPESNTPQIRRWL